MYWRFFPKKFQYIRVNGFSKVKQTERSHWGFLLGILVQLSCIIQPLHINPALFTELNDKADIQFVWKISVYLLSSRSFTFSDFHNFIFIHYHEYKTATNFFDLISVKVTFVDKMSRLFVFISSSKEYFMKVKPSLKLCWCE